MARFLMMSLIVVCISISTSATQHSFDYKSMTPEEIEQLKADRHAYYDAESAGKSQAIREELFNKSVYLDGNESDYDVRYYGINTKLDFTTGTENAHVDYLIRSTISSLNAIDLNLHDQLTVDSVLFGTTHAAFTHSNNILSIATPSPKMQGVEFAMTVYYHGTPHFDGQQGMGFGTVGGTSMCWTNCEPFSSRYWWPCKDYTEDKPDSIDIFVDYPNTMKVISNGVIVTDVASGTGRKLCHYKHRHPISTYLVAIAVANFDNSGAQTWNYKGISMPVVNYTCPGYTAAKNSFSTWMLPALTYESDRWGTYPWNDEKAGNAHYGWGGAMEHQTCSFYNPTFYNDWVIAHETGHQWWGDMITCNTFNDIWLNEGFATYSEALFMEARDGQTAFRNYMQSERFIGSGSVYVENLQTDDIFDHNLVYDKAAWVLHMLRGILGDSSFYAAIADYYSSPYKYNSANTGEFSQIISSYVGSDMSYFFNQWIYGTGNPDYEISWLNTKDSINGGYQIDYFIRQKQSGTYFKMPIKHTFVTAGGSKDTTIWNQGPGEAYTFHWADSLRSVLFDPQQWILRTVSTAAYTMHITSDIPGGYLSVPYSLQLHAVGGTHPYHWSLVGGDIPYGLTFNGDTVGTITGTPSWKSTYYFTIQSQDASLPPLTEQISYAVTITDSPQQGMHGDADGNSLINISDAVYLIQFIFSGGPAPTPMTNGDANCDLVINISDAVFLIQYIFGSGPAPNCP